MKVWIFYRLYPFNSYEIESEWQTTTSKSIQFSVGI